MWASGSPSAGRAVLAREGRRARVGHVLDRDDDLEVELLPRPASTISHSRFGPTRNWAIRSSGRCVAERPIRWTERARGRARRSLPLLLRRALPRRRVDQVLEPLQGQRQVGAPLGLGDRVDLVDDHRLDRGEDLAGARGEHQVERLGGGDQDVGRRFAHRPALGLAGVAGPQADRDLGADPPQRRPQVALDVVGERLQRRDVDDPHARRRAPASRASRSIPQRKPASVLPEPVGAQISALAPPEIASQPPAWAGVGPSKEASNQRRTGALNGASGSDPALVLRDRWPTHRSYAARCHATRRPAAGESARRRTRPSSARSLRRRGRSRRRSCSCPARRRPRTSRRAADLPSALLCSSSRNAPFSCAPARRGPWRRSRRGSGVGAPAELGDPEALAGVVVLGQHARGILRSSGVRCLYSACRGAGRRR